MVRAGLDAAAVVAAAAQLADAHGLDRLTLAGVADDLGVRAPSLYAHVHGLADLRARIGARAARELTVVLSAAAAGRSGRDALRAVADAYRGFAAEHPGAYTAMQRSPEDTRGEAAAAAAALLEVFVAMLRGYGLQAEEGIHAVRIVRSALHGFVSLERDGGFRMAISLAESYDRLIAMLDRGLASIA